MANDLGLRFWFGPLAVLFDQIHQALDGFRFGDVELYRSFTHVQVDLPWSPADITEVGIGHFPRTIDDTAHDGDLDPFQMLCSGFDPRGDRLEVKKCAA